MRHSFLQFECYSLFFFFSSRRRHTRLTCDWSSYVCSSDLPRRDLQGAQPPDVLPEGVDSSQNIWWLGPLQVTAWGENWHGNHHGYPASASFSRHWWQRSEERRVGKEWRVRWSAGH